MKKLACFDMDGTLIDCEFLEEVAKEIGIEKEVAEITRQGMLGEIGFRQSLEKRVRLLKGMEVRRMLEIARNVPLMPGAVEAVARLKQAGFYVVMITGGFECVAEVIAKRVGVDRFVANNFEVEEGCLTGGFVLRVDGNKDVLLKEFVGVFGAKFVVAVGDGYNDIPMLRAADVGIAFNAKKCVEDAVEFCVRKKDLMCVLDVLG